jgi:hypothetical protein
MSDKPKDLGAIGFVVAADPEAQLVIIQFSKPANRIEFAPEQALEIASTIMTRAAVAAGVSLQELIDKRELKNRERQKAVEEQKFVVVKDDPE